MIQVRFRTRSYCVSWAIRRVSVIQKATMSLWATALCGIVPAGKVIIETDCRFPAVPTVILCAIGTEERSVLSGKLVDHQDTLCTKSSEDSQSSVLIEEVTVFRNRPGYPKAELLIGCVAQFHAARHSAAGIAEIDGGSSATHESGSSPFRWCRRWGTGRAIIPWRPELPEQSSPLRPDYRSQYTWRVLAQRHSYRQLYRRYPVDR